MKLEALLLVLLAGITSCLGSLALKHSRLIAEPGADFLTKLLSPYFFAGLAFYGINVVLFAKALDTAPVSGAYPVLAASSFALLTFASAWLFGERIGAMQIAGLMIVIFGMALLARGG